LQTWQDKLLEVQFMKTNNTAKNEQQDNEDYYNTKTLFYDWKTWYALIIINENMTEQIHKNHNYLIIKSNLNSLKEWEQYNNIIIIKHVKHFFQNAIWETCTHYKKKCSDN